MMDHLHRFLITMLICWLGHANIVLAQTASRALAVATGWSLFGNGVDTAIDVASVFGDGSKYASVWTYIPATGNWSFYTPTLSDGGQAYAASKGYAYLTTINPGDGYWLNARVASSVDVPDGNPVSVAPSSLSSGWNLRASRSPLTPAQLATDMGSALRSIWAWDSAQGAWRYYSPALAAQGGTALADFIAGSGYLAFADAGLDPDSGFWIGGSATAGVDPPPMPGGTPAQPLVISGSSAVNALGSAAYSAMITMGDGSRKAVTATWWLTGTGASMDALTGVLTASKVTSDRTVVVNASYTDNGQRYTGTVAVTVLTTPRTLTGLSISGPSTVKEDGAYTVTASFADGSTATVPATLSLEPADSYARLVGNTLTSSWFFGDRDATLTVSVIANYTESGISKTASLPVTLAPTHALGLTGLHLVGPESVLQGSSASYSLLGIFDSGGFSSPVTGGILSLLPTPYASVSGMTLTANTVATDQVLTLYASLDNVVATKSVTITPVRQLTGLGIEGPATIASGGAAVYTLRATYNDASQSAVSGSLTLDTTYYASVSGSILTAASGGAGHNVHLRATYTEGGVTMTADMLVTIALAGGPDSPVPLNLVSGWNLLGKSVAGAVNVASIFGDSAQVKSVWKWNSAKAAWAFYTPMLPDGGAAYAASQGYEQLSTIDGGEGFWVNANTVFPAQFAPGIARTAASFQELHAGWSLIAIGDNRTPSQFNQALSVTPPTPGLIPLNLTSLWAWNTALTSWHFYSPALEAKGGSALDDYIASKGYLNFGAKVLDPAMGFWVNRQ